MSEFNILARDITPAQDENLIRAYHCTSLRSRLLALSAEGYLTVTNKRVIFYAFGSSYGGKSTLQSEVPIEDVSGISSYKGNYFSFMHLLGAIFASLLVANFVNFLVVGSITLIATALYAGLSRSSGGFGQSNAGVGLVSIVLWVLAIGVFLLSLSLGKEKIFRSILAGISTLFFIDLSGMSFLSTSLGSFFFQSGTRSTFLNQLSSGAAALALVFAFAAAIYTLVCVFWYARRETISLAIGSQGSSSTAIAISGVSSFSLYNTAAMKALSAEPAAEAEPMIKELGAMILDIQTLGDFGIQKWKEKSNVYQVGPVPPIGSASVSPAG